MPLNRWTRLAVPIAVALSLGAAACGSSSTSSAGNGAAASSSGGITLKAGVFSWTAAAVETDILDAIAQAHPDLGVKGIQPVKLDPAAGWVGLQRGDVDLLTEVNLPNQQPFLDKAKSQVELASKVYGGAVQGWFVPRYAVDGPNAPLAGLKSIDQLNQYKDKLGDTLYDGDPGWITTQQDDKRLRAYGLQLKHVKSSEAALIAQVERAYARKQPVLFFFYRPHWLFSRYDVVQLQEPNPYRSGCFTGADDKCAIPTQTAWIADRKDLAQRAPKFAAMVKHVHIPLGEIEKLLNQVDQQKRDPAAVAQAWVDAHKSEVDGWIG